MWQIVHDLHKRQRAREGGRDGGNEGGWQRASPILSMALHGHQYTIAENQVSRARQPMRAGKNKTDFPITDLECDDVTRKIIRNPTFGTSGISTLNAEHASMASSHRDLSTCTAKSWRRSSIFLVRFSVHLAPH